MTDIITKQVNELKEKLFDEICETFALDRDKIYSNYRHFQNDEEVFYAGNVIGYIRHQVKVEGFDYKYKLNFTPKIQ